MGNLTFSYGFRRFRLSSGGHIDRPMINVIISNPDEGSRRIEASMLVDSGADYSMLPREVADDLGIDLDACPIQTVDGVSGSMEVALCDLRYHLAQQQRTYDFLASTQIPLNCPNYPRVWLMGREPCFQLFDVRFRMSFTDVLGKTTLRLVEKQRDGARFSVGGNPLKPE